jgi:hypothetical protein
VRLFLIALLIAPFAFADTPVGATNYVAGDLQSDPRVAANGEGFFAAWFEGRPRAVGIYGARFTADGRPLDPNGIFLGEGWYASAVVWSGRNWLVFIPEENSDNVRIVVVDREGHHTAPRLILATDGGFSVASNGSITVVTDSDAIAVFDPDGKFVERKELPPSPAPIDRGTPAIVSNGDGFYVMWNLHNGRNFGAQGARLDRNASPLDAKAVLLCSTGLHYTGASIYPQGRDYLMAGLSISGGSLVRHIGADGSLGPLEQQRPWNWDTTPIGDHFIDPANEGSTLVLRMFDRYHHPLDELRANNAMSGELWLPIALATNGTNVLAVWTELRSSSQLFQFRLIAVSFDLRSRRSSPRTEVGVSAAEQWPTGIAAGNNGFAVAWQETTDDYFSIDEKIIDRRYDSYISLVDPTGNPASFTRLNDTGVSAIAPRITWNGSHYEAAWIELSGRDRVLKTMQLGDAEAQTFGASGCANDVDLASNGDVTLVTWTDCALHDIFAARLRNGRLLDWVPLKISRHDSDAFDASRPRVSWNGEAFVVVWKQTAAEPVDDELHLARVTPELTLLDPRSIVIPLFLNLSDPQYEVASSSRESLIVYVGISSSSPLEARFLSHDGTLSEPVVLGRPTWLKTFTAPSVTWDGSRYVVAWSSDLDISAVHLSRDGELSPESTITASPNFDLRPLVAAANGALLLAWNRNESAAPYFGSRRTFLRFFPAN